MNAQTDNVPIDSQPSDPISPISPIPPAARRFLEETTMKSIFGISDEALDAVMALAYQLYRTGRYPEAEVLCRGLVAADHTYWWSYSLYAATLRRLGRLPEALAALEKGLTHEPDEPKLLVMRDELRRALAPGENGSSSSSTSNPRVAA
jgi:tetratricopeptide (TPR) repeat protein